MTASNSGVAPWVVALLRGVVEAAVLGVLGVLIVWLGDVTAGALAAYAPLGVVLLRQLEGLADQKIDPTKQRVAGGTAANTSG